MRSILRVDWRDAWRSLTAAPLVPLVIVLSLGLGIGATTALFTVLNGLTLKPLPVHEPERLVYLEDMGATNPIWEHVRDHHSGVSAGAFAWSSMRFDTAVTGESAFVNGVYASGRMFQVLGVPATIGRTFDERDDRPGGGDAGPVAVLSHRYWRQRFSSDPRVLGSTIHLEQQAFQIVGVAAPGFVGLNVNTPADIFIPIGTEPLIRGRDSMLTRPLWWLDMMFRLRPDQTLESFASELNAVRPRIRHATLPPREQDDYLTKPFSVASGAAGRSALRTRFVRPLTIVLVIVGLVLLIACANIASLLLARAVARRREFSLRLALGASRWRVSRQLFIESGILAGAGVILGMLVAYFGSRALVWQLSTWRATPYVDLSPDWRVLGFTAAVAIVAALLFGLAPAATLSGVAPNNALKDDNRGTGGDRTGTVSGALVVTQVALSLALVFAASLFGRSYGTLTGRDRGFTRADVLIARVGLTGTSVATANHVQAFTRLRDVVLAVPGIQSAAVSYTTPISGSGWTDRVASGPAVAENRGNATWVNLITPGWLATYGIRLVEGRDFGPGDTLGNPRVAIVDRAFAEKYLPRNERAVGQRFTLSGHANGPAPFEVVGVVDNTLHRSLRDEKTPTVFRPFAQWDASLTSAALSLRAAVGNPKALSRAVAEAVTREYPGARVSLNSLDDQIAASITEDRLVARMSGFFGALALLLAGLGIYGVVAYSVSRRRREIGIRMALGADPGAVVRMVLRGLALLLGLGLAGGVLLSLWASKYIKTLLYQVEPQDPATVAAAAAVLAAAGVLAGWLPARRAALVDPTIVLRD